MRPIRTLIAQTRDDPVVQHLAATLRTSPGFALFADPLWSAAELQSFLAQDAPAEIDLAILVGEGTQIERLSSELLRRYPRLVVVRIHVDPSGRVPNTPERVGGTAIIVDLLQHFALDPGQYGTERLIRAFRYLVEHQGAGAVDRLARYLIVHDPDTARGEGVRLIAVGSNGEPERARAGLPQIVTAWLNATISEYLRSNPLSEGEDGGFFVGRRRAVNIINALSGHSEEQLAESGRLASGARANLESFLRDPAHIDGPLVVLTQRLGLSMEAIEALLICLSPEIDLGYQLIIGHLHDDMSRRHASPALIDALLHRHGTGTSASALAELVRWRLLATDSVELPGADEALKVDRSIAGWLLVDTQALLRDPLIAPLIATDRWPGEALADSPEDAGAIDSLAAVLRSAHRGGEWHVLTGDDPDGWRALLEHTARVVKVGLLRVLVAKLPLQDWRLVHEISMRLARAARLLSLQPVFDAIGVTAEPAELRRVLMPFSEKQGTAFLLAADSRQVAVLLDEMPWRVHTRIAPGIAVRTHYFQAALNRLGIRAYTADAERVHAERLAIAYPLSAAGVANAMMLAAPRLQTLQRDEDRLRTFADACRHMAAPDILQLARRLEPKFSLDQLIVPSDQRVQLEEVLANVAHSRTVLERWGFAEQLPYGRGVTALFSGPSGTGKTMAAQAIARQLGVDVFAVDLSRIVSKYIGETEKHLNQVFADAERAGSVLLFDEAEALFGRRSEVKDAHDRYANIEVAYLLQRMEAFGGLAILTTNHRQHLDSAFVRRLRFIVEFPRPDAAARERIWQLCIPDSAPASAEIDWRLLAHFDLTGGAIRQVTLRAAFLAARENSPGIMMAHLIHALRGELQKLGLQAAERELVEYLACAHRAGARAA